MNELLNRPWKSLRVAFVGMKRPPSDMPIGYWPTFVKHHLELPWYYARYSDCLVDVTTVEPVEYAEEFGFFSDCVAGGVRTVTEMQYLDPEFDEKSAPYDVVVHWRKWNDDLYMPGARNVILSQDHSYSAEWKADVRSAMDSGRLDGLLVFPTWHKENTARELMGIVPRDRLYEGMTLGVDTDVYHPISKDPFHMLWASDPGRGLESLINPFLRLWSSDRRYRLTVTYPDYVKPELVARFSAFLKHPGVRHLPGLRNGPGLWELFNKASFLPYSSTFLEPSSRCHRQAMASGCVVMYPPNMGTPSELIEADMTGIVAPPELWPDVVLNLASSGRREEIGHNARTFALTENWRVQAKRFHKFFSKGQK